MHPLILLIILKDASPAKIIDTKKKKEELSAPYKKKRMLRGAMERLNFVFRQPGSSVKLYLYNFMHTLIILLIIFLNDASPACFAIRAAFSTVNS